MKHDKRTPHNLHFHDHTYINTHTTSITFRFLLDKVGETIKRKINKFVNFVFHERDDNRIKSHT